MKDKDKSLIQPKPTKGLKRKPRCFGQRVVNNSCIRCVWIERCLHESYKTEIKEFKEKHPDKHEDYIQKVTSTLSFEE